MRYVYTGPSWAASSFPVDANSTNLSRQWNIPCIDLAQPGASVLSNIRRLEKDKSNLPIIWIYNEPLLDIEHILGISKVELLTNDNWQTQRDFCNQYCLEQISKLGRPVLLIGGHSDIRDCKFSNIRVTCASWQKFIAGKAGLSIVDGTVTGTYDSGTEFKVSHCWGAEIMHRTIFENPNIQPTKDLVESIWDTFFFWKEIERLGWFFDVHPNKLATETFAEFLLPDVIKFLEDTK
jgi:hypothetical protein